jgi:hypothetical protein
MQRLFEKARRGVRRRWIHARANQRLTSLDEAVNRAAPQPISGKPVVLFNASTRLLGLSQNAGFQQIVSWALRLAGIPTIQFVCQSGLKRCVLAAAQHGAQELPPCAGCIAQSRAIYAHSHAHWFIYRPDLDLEEAIASLTVDQLAQLEWQGMPLGQLCMPALRWTLRRHTLSDDEDTRFLFRAYILSAWRVAQEFEVLLRESQPRAVVVFNGMFYPEAAARWVAEQRFHLPVYSHEVGLRPFTAFFTDGDATAYPIQIPDSFQLTAEQDKRLDAYLEQRLKGNFTMAGVRFWPEMRGLDQAFLAKVAAYRQVVPVFTNVIFDTSQPHSNVVFPHMFTWLDQLLDFARLHPDTLFVLRAHPDESRPGKAAKESVAQWAEARQISQFTNVHFVDSRDYFSSYELIQRSKFVMVYNSTIGLEASLMGAPVLCAGKARFTQLPTVFFPTSMQAYWQTAQQFLDQDRIAIPPEFRLNARRFLYYQLYKTSLPFDQFLEEDGVWNGFVRLKDLAAAAFSPQDSLILRTIVNGIENATPFLLEE